MINIPSKKNLRNKEEGDVMKGRAASGGYDFGVVDKHIWVMWVGMNLWGCANTILKMLIMNIQS